MSRARLSLALVSLFAAACGADASGGVPGARVDGGVASDAGDDTDAFVIECEPPDFMVILDRSGSMSQRPDGTMPPNTAAGADETKWSMAVSALEALTASRDDTVRFGLALFPLDPEGADGTDCSNLDTWLTEFLPPESNDPVCLPAEVLVTPQLGTALAIDQSISRDQTGLCTYTPIGAGFEAAQQELASVRDGLRDQYALLIADGADTCDFREGYDSDSLQGADALRDQGVKIFVVGFDGSGDGIDAPHLNHLACAGGTAPNFDANCTLANGHYRAADAEAGPRLFLLAENAVGLEQALASVTDEVCCGCVD